LNLLLLNMARAKNPVESIDELEKGQKVTFWRSVGENMSKKNRGEIKSFENETHAEIEFRDNKTVTIEIFDIEKPQ
jgi:ribosome maturation factor RimP